jgi:hypothetical protein
LNFGCRTLALFKGAGFLSRRSLFPLDNSDPFFLRAQRAAGRKTRTLHKNREECGTPILEMDKFARRQVFIEQALTPVGRWSPGKFPHHTAFRVLVTVNLL